jgi:dsRNA-specific ribonuclease
LPSSDALLDLFVSLDLLRNANSGGGAPASPYSLTVQRSQDVRNARLAAAAAELGLHTAIRVGGRALRAALERYAGVGAAGEAAGGGGGQQAVDLMAAAAAARPMEPWADDVSEAIWAEVWTNRGDGGASGGEGAEEPGLQGEGRDASARQLPQEQRPPKVMADVVEALIAAVWLDSGGDYEAAWRVAARVLAAGAARG